MAKGKRGISKIEGEAFPQVGEAYTYRVAEWYNGIKTIAEKNINWVLFRLVKNKWEKVKGAPKVGPIINTTFLQHLYGEKLLLEAYASAPERKSPPGIVIIPLAGNPKITNAEILDKDGKAVSGPLYYGDTVTIKATTANMLGKSITLSLWDDDWSEKGDDLLWGRTKIKVEAKNGIVERTLVLSPAMRKAGGVMGNGGVHKYYLKVEADQTKEVRSAIVTVKIDKPTNSLTNKGNSAATTGKAAQKEEKGNNCQKCDDDITLEQIKAICVSKKNKKGQETCLVKDDTFISAALPFLNQYRVKAGIKTCITKAHFIAQICQESKFYDLQEDFIYRDPERMRGIFKSYFKQFGELKKQQAEAKRLSDLSLDSKNWEEVANAIYGKTHPLGKLHTDKDDGWRYSGKGYKQITWKENYQNVQTAAEKHFGVKKTWIDGNNPFKLKADQEDAMLSALAFWKMNNISAVATNQKGAVRNVTLKVNPALAGYDERARFFDKAYDILEVAKCKPKAKESSKNEKGAVVIVSGTDTRIEKDAFRPDEFSWLMYKTSVYNDMSLATYYDLEKANQLPEPDYTTYLSRDTHQTSTSTGKILKHSDKRFGQYNEIPPGEYYLVPGIAGQKYKIYVIDSETKSAAAENGIDGPDGSRGGVALHQYSPRFSVGCFTFNSGKNTQPISDLIDNLPDLPIGDSRPIRFIVQPRKVTESTWSNATYGTKKWTGVQ